MMELGQVIPYSGSKAVKITKSMKKDLDTYNQRRHEIAGLTDEVTQANVLHEEKSAEIAALQEQAKSEDKKEARDANKKIKGIEKEIDKIDANIKGLEDKKTKLVTKQDKGKIDGVQMIEISAKEETTEEAPTDTPVNDETIVPVAPEETSVEPVIVENDTVDESDDLSAELDDDFPINSETTDVVTEPEKNPTDETEEKPVEEYNESDEFTPTDDSKVVDSILTEDDAEEIWEGLKNVELNDESTTNSDTPEPIVPDYSTTPVVPMYDEPMITDEATEEATEVEETPVTPEISEEEIKAEVHQEIEQSIPAVDLVAPVETENVMNDVYNEVGVTPEEPVRSKERNLNDLSLFEDYEDYTFTFGQQHYGKEALTPAELGALEAEKDFLAEKSFYTKRTSQYGKISDENKKLKKKVVTLGKEFKKKTNAISAEYTANVEELTKTTDAAKEQAETDRVEKIQTQKLNDSLTATIKEQTENIETLTDKNSNLQATIDDQNNRIAELEKENQEQAEKISMFEEKLNTVFGIVKEVSND